MVGSLLLLLLPVPPLLTLSQLLQVVDQFMTVQKLIFLMPVSTPTLQSQYLLVLVQRLLHLLPLLLAPQVMRTA